MLYRSLCAGFALVLGTCAGLAQAFAENRVALVIGNSAYKNASALPNPANDAKAMTTFLKSANFDVTEVQDLGQGEMRAAIGQFADTISGKGRDTVALVYYAGHGLQVDGENFLVPVDANIAREADVQLQAVRLSDLLNALAAVPTKTRIVMLDACRNNPFSAINKVTGRGLAIVDAPPGTIISYATSPGSVALDGDGANSPYTNAMLSLTKEPGLPVEQAFKRVRFAVNDATNRQQLPWESSSLTSDFSFFPGPDGATPAATQVAARSNGGASNAKTMRSMDAWKKELQRRSASEAYEVVIREDSVEAYQAFIALFPSQPNSPRVREVLDRRRVMIAWYATVTADTPAAYQAFLAAYADTDLTATARRLMERANSRSIGVQTANVCPCALQPQPQMQPQRPKPGPREQRAARPTKKEAKRNQKSATRTQRVRDPEDNAPVVQQATPMPVPMMMPIGIGIGGGMMGGGMGRGMAPGPYRGGNTGGGMGPHNRPPAR
jgi:uncharacterized caspase-like protein